MKESTLFVWIMGLSNIILKRRIHLLPQSCTILTDEGKVNTPGSSSNQGGDIIASNPAKEDCTLWIVYGTRAAIAWAILVQL
jgi:hypothetical protein